ncbi:hypothetical protein [Candidatus Enterovibrio escicola]|nr:hypothetical protein [Candidatus Enterovibrio escacola]
MEENILMLKVAYNVERLHQNNNLTQEQLTKNIGLYDRKISSLETMV